jgi:uncharacterized protein (DUF1778 family)
MGDMTTTSTASQRKRPAGSQKPSERRERFAARLSPSRKELLQRAAELTGQTLSEFVLGAAQAAAERTIRDRQVLELTARETEEFLAALANPPRLSPKLEEALRQKDGRTELVW